MADLRIRNLDEDVVAALKRQAKAHHRSLEAEVRDILNRAVRPAPKAADLRALAEQIAQMTPKGVQADSAKLVREDRDR